MDWNQQKQEWELSPEEAAIVKAALGTDDEDLKEAIAKSDPLVQKFMKALEIQFLLDRQGCDYHNLMEALGRVFDYV